MTTQAAPLDIPCHVCGTPGCEGQCSLPPTVRHAVPLVVAEFASELQRHAQQLEESNLRLRAELSRLTSEMESAVVTLRSGKRRTLWSLWESGDTEDLCRVCSEPECQGIENHPGILRREAAEDEGDES